MIHKIHRTPEQEQAIATGEILDTLKQMNSKIQEEIPVNSLMRVIKGEKGDKHTDEELLTLIRPLIPPPIKGEKGDMPNIDKVANIVQSRINLEKVAKLAAEIAVKLIDLPEIDTEDEIIEKINDSKKMIDAERVRGLVDVIKENRNFGSYPMGGGSAGGSVKMETPPETPDSIITVFTVTKTPKWVIADGATYFDGAGYTAGAGNITMSIPPTSFIRYAI